MSNIPTIQFIGLVSFSRYQDGNLKPRPSTPDTMKQLLKDGHAVFTADEIEDHSRTLKYFVTFPDEQSLHDLLTEMYAHEATQTMGMITHRGHDPAVSIDGERPYAIPNGYDGSDNIYLSLDFSSHENPSRDDIVKAGDIVLGFFDSVEAAFSYGIDIESIKLPTWTS